MEVQMVAARAVAEAGPAMMTDDDDTERRMMVGAEMETSTVVVAVLAHVLGVQIVTDLAAVIVVEMSRKIELAMIGVIDQEAEVPRKSLHHLSPRTNVIDAPSLFNSLLHVLGLKSLLLFSKRLAL